MNHIDLVTSDMKAKLVVHEVNQTSCRWIILCVHPANERRCYNKKVPLIGQVHAQNDPWMYVHPHFDIMYNFSTWIDHMARKYIYDAQFRSENTGAVFMANGLEAWTYGPQYL